MFKFKGYSYKDGGIISGIDKIVESINILMSTEIGTRVYDYNYGNRIIEQLFETYTDRDYPIIVSYIEDILSRERRVELESDSISVDVINETNLQISFNINYKGAKINFIYYRSDN